jgi:hypothetical protein
MVRPPDHGEPYLFVGRAFADDLTRSSTGSIVPRGGGRDHGGSRSPLVVP